MTKLKINESKIISLENEVINFLKNVKTKRILTHVKNLTHVKKLTQIKMFHERKKSDPCKNN